MERWCEKGLILEFSEYNKSVKDEVFDSQEGIWYYRTI